MILTFMSVKCNNDILDNTHTCADDTSSTTSNENFCSVVEVEVEYFAAKDEVDDTLNMTQNPAGDENEEYYDEQTPILSHKVIM